MTSGNHGREQQVVVGLHGERWPDDWRDGENPLVEAG